ncbi:MAG: RimK family alpha-L-glutamate ligase [Actinomycetota bacterium]
MAKNHLIGLLLGTEEDWPGAFEAMMRRLNPTIQYGDDTHTFSTERITIEPFDLQAIPRHRVVIDRLAYWYYVPREWLKKVALMNGVYLLNNPFTFQAMEKHAAYCAMMRLGLHVPETWMLPTKKPPENPRFPYTAAKYNLPFRLEDVAHAVGYPLFMKPFDGGAWVGVTRIKDDDELHRRYDESGERLMHLQKSIEDFDIFVRSLSIGAETMVMHYDPDKPMHDRYQISHGFLTPELGEEVVTIGRLVNAFFLWEFNSCETIIKDEVVYPIDYANANPDIALTSLHYYFPWAIKALIKWSIFCATTGRPMRIDQETDRYFEIGDTEDLSYEEKLEGYRSITDEYFDAARYHEFCAEHLADIDEVMLEYIESDEFDRLLLETVISTFPAPEHEKFVEHYRGIMAAWAKDQHNVAAPR